MKKGGFTPTSTILEVVDAGSELLHRFDEWSDQQAVVQLVVFFLRVVWDIHTHWRCLHVLIRLEDLLGNQSVRRFTLKRVCYWLEFGNESIPGASPVTSFKQPSDVVPYVMVAPELSQLMNPLSVGPVPVKV